MSGLRLPDLNKETTYLLRNSTGQFLAKLAEILVYSQSNSVCTCVCVSVC